VNSVGFDDKLPCRPALIVKSFEYAFASRGSALNVGIYALASSPK
jgi:hypothetical protein